MLRKMAACNIGFGQGSRLEWINNKWTTTKEFDVHKEDDSTKWNISYPLKREKRLLLDCKLPFISLHLKV